MEHDMKRSYEELEDTCNALTQALGMVHREVEKLTEDFVNERTISNMYARSKQYAFEDLATMTAKYKEAQSLLDGCYEVVEIWDCQAPSQIEWKRGWLEGARRHGATTF